MRRTPAQILAALLRAKNKAKAIERAGLEQSAALLGLITRAEKGNKAPALSFLEKAVKRKAGQHPADVLFKRLRRFKPGSRGFKRLARDLEISPQDLRRLRNSKSLIARRRVYDTWTAPIISSVREWPIAAVIDDAGIINRERMTEYLVPHPWQIRFLDHATELPYVQLEAVWNQSSYTPGTSPEGAESGGWESDRRPSEYLAGLYEAAAIIAMRSKVVGHISIRIKEYSR